MKKLAMYKYSCYIENTKEAREWLEYLGIKKYVNSFGYDYPYLFFDADSGEYIIDQIIENDPTLHEYTSCLGNLPLFKALTAVRDDSDYMQYFVAHCFLDFSKGNKEEYYSARELFLCKEKDVEDLEFNFLRLPQSKGNSFFHKATDKELIEKFKEKNND